MTDMVRCPNCKHEFDYLEVPEAGMGYAKCPKCAYSITQGDAIDHKKDAKDLENAILAKKEAMVHKDALEFRDTNMAVYRIESSPLPGINTEDRLNNLIIDHWKAIRRYNDKEFIEKVLSPLQKKYTGIVSLENLESKTRRISTWKP